MNTLHLVRSDIVDLSPQIQKVNNTSANVGQCHSLPFNLYEYRRKNANMVLKVYLNRNKSATYSRAKTLQQMCRLHENVHKIIHELNIFDHKFCLSSPRNRFDVQSTNSTGYDIAFKLTVTNFSKVS